MLQCAFITLSLHFAVISSTPLSIGLFLSLPPFSIYPINHSHNVYAAVLTVWNDASAACNNGLQFITWSSRDRGSGLKGEQCRGPPTPPWQFWMIESHCFLCFVTVLEWKDAGLGAPNQSRFNWRAHIIHRMLDGLPEFSITSVIIRRSQPSYCSLLSWDPHLGQ